MRRLIGPFMCLGGHASGRMHSSPDEHLHLPIFTENTEKVTDFDPSKPIEPVAGSIRFQIYRLTWWRSGPSEKPVGFWVPIGQSDRESEEIMMKLEGRSPLSQTTARTMTEMR